jgi:hypothetical protein
MRTFSLRKTAGAAAAIAALGAASLGLAPAASASSGGGCGATTSGGYVNVTACISAKGAAVYPDGYANWVGIGSPPSSCSVTLELFDGSGTMVASRNWACGQSHYGPFAWAGTSPSTWSSLLVVRSSYGTVYASSKIQVLSY